VCLDAFGVVRLTVSETRARHGHPLSAAAPVGILLAHFIVSDNVERSRRLYTEVLGGREARLHVPIAVINPSRNYLAGDLRGTATSGAGRLGARAPVARLRAGLSVALRSGTFRLADPGRNAVTARHHDNGKGNEGEKEEYQEQGGHAVPASLLLSLTRPQVCLTAHCVPLQER